MVLVLALIALVALPGGGSAEVITSPGPLTDVTVSMDLACQVESGGEVDAAFFPGAGRGACGTFVGVIGNPAVTVYGPNVPAGPDRAAYVPLSQSMVTGAGSAADPFSVTTVVDLGQSGVRLTETDQYIVGEQYYRTEIALSNRSAAAVPAILYHAGDCFMGATPADTGYGRIDTATGGTFCTANPPTGPAGRTVGFVPLSSGSSRIEGAGQNVWSSINGTVFRNTCECFLSVDNAAGVSWPLTIAPGETLTRSLATTFSPSGVFVDTPPETDITGGPLDGSTVTYSTPAFSFSATEAGSSFECRVDGDAFAACPSPYMTRELDPGTHIFEVRAKDPAGNVDLTPARRSFKFVDTKINDAPSPATMTHTPTFGFITSEPGATFECRVDDAAFAPCSSPFQTAFLAAGPHSFEIRARDAAGNVIGTDKQSFTVLEPDPPVRGETMNAFVTSGQVRVRLPHHKKAETLRRPRHLPVGTVFDTTRGHMRLDTASDAKGKKIQSAAISSGTFVVRQKHSSKRATLILRGAVGPCTTATAGKAISAKKHRKRKRRHLWVKTHGKGTYTTSGKYGSGSVRGTQWFTEDRCDGTLVSVKRGVVAVRDFARHRTVRVKKGHHYLARKPAR